MADDQRHGRIFGVLFVITFLTSIPAYLIFESVLDDPAGFIGGDGSMGWLYFAILLEFFLVLSNVGTAVVLYPIARRQNEALAIGYVAARIIESVFIAVGIIFVLGLVTMRLDGVGSADMATLLYELKDWTFLFGPGLIVPFGNGLILGYLMYRSGLVPQAHGLARTDRRPDRLLLEPRHHVRLVGPGYRDDPRAPRGHLGALRRLLLRDLRVQEGLADRPSELARQCSRLTPAQRQRSDCSPCRASSSPFSS